MKLRCTQHGERALFFKNDNGKMVVIHRRNGETCDSTLSLGDTRIDPATAKPAARRRVRRVSTPR